MRILYRLEFYSPSRKSSRQPVKTVLREAVRCVGQLKNQLAIVGPLEERAREVMKLVDAWTKHQILARLEELVEKIDRVSLVGDLRALIDKIPNRLMGPNRKSIVNMVGKVARYRGAARFLCRTAKKFPLTRRMK